jgi:hypothetical protein
MADSEKDASQAIEERIRELVWEAVALNLEGK